MLADELDFVIGVDPHRDAHAIAVVEVCTGVVVVESSVAADSGGYREALRVAEEHAPGLRPFATEGAADSGGYRGALGGAEGPAPGLRAFAIGGAGSFGAGLSRFLAEQGEQVF